MISQLTPGTEVFICTRKGGGDGGGGFDGLHLLCLFDASILTPTFTPAPPAANSFLPLSPQTETETTDVLD